MLPKKLTSASRKRSPPPPGKPHPRRPETLTDTSRTSSPIAPASAHRSAPERLTGTSRRCSPAVPGKAHRMLPYRLTTLSRKSSLTAPEKSHLSHLRDGFESARPAYGREYLRAHRLKRRRKTNIAARWCASPDLIRASRYRRDRQARHVGKRFIRDDFSTSLHS